MLPPTLSTVTIKGTEMCFHNKSMWSSVSGGSDMVQWHLFDSVLLIYANVNNCLKISPIKLTVPRNEIMHVDNK